VVDGSNIAHLEKSAEGKPKLSNILAVRKRLRDLGYRPVIIVDASLYHHIDNADQLHTMIERDEIKQAPAGTDADYFVLKTAQLERARVVTNDQYNDHQASFGDVDRWRVPVMIVDGLVELYHLPRAGERAALES
jgi:replication-associated recombination protein RarA